MDNDVIHLDNKSIHFALQNIHMTTSSRAKSDKPAVERKAADFWDMQARNVLRSELQKADIDMATLSKKLAAIGYPPVSEKALALRIARGTFTAGFMLMVLQALGVRTSLDISYVKESDRMPGRKPKQQAD